MHLYAAKSGQGSPVILLHGLFAMGQSMGMVARSLAETFTVYSLDLRNHGRSPRTAYMDFTVMAQDVLAWMDGEGIDAVRILGHSLGGKVAMQLALSAPERVQALAVADIAPVDYGVSEEHQRILDALHAVDLKKIQSRSDAEAILSTFIKERGVRLFLLTNLYKNDRGLFDWRCDIAALKRNYDHLRDALLQGEYGGPALFIYGSESEYMSDRYADDIGARFSHAEYYRVEGAGHWLHVDKTSEFNNVVARFFSR